ncbi:MAG TPA: FtsQ-type POTRA domain-containing protein [Acetobacteraceae bacterium]|nr:FtsQ-type POTRA domain-containing protein [Acetobacteraceae bacterium]
MPRVTRRPGGPTGDRPSALRLLLRRGWKLVRPVRWVVFGCVVLVGGAVALHLLLPPGSGSQSGTGAASGGSLTTFRERIGNATASLGLRVETVVIEGRANTPEPLLRAALGISKGDPILGFSLDAARRNVEKLSWVEQATIERRLPDTVVVQLVERRPFAIWQNQGKFVLIDRDGQTVTNEDVGQFRQLPLVVGPGAPGAATPLIDALMAHPGLLARVVAAVRVGERRWNLQLRGGMNVMLPEGREAVAIERLVVLQQDHALLDRPLEVVDMRLPDRLVLRPRAEPAADAAAKKPT